MKRSHTLLELSKSLNVAKRQLQRDLDGIPYREETHRGGPRRVYNFDDLPLDMRRVLIAHELGVNEDVLPPHQFDESRARELIERWQSAQEWARDVAHGRYEILERVKLLAASQNLSITRAEEVFSEMHGKGQIPDLTVSASGEGDGLSFSTLSRWRLAHEADGLIGLLPAWGKKRGRVFAIPPEAQIFIAGQLKMNPDIRVTRIHEMLAVQFPDIKQPDRKTVSNFIKNRWTGPNAENRQLFAAMKDPRDWRNRYLPAFGNMAANVLFAGHTWEADDTRHDAWTEGAVELQGVRYTITQIVDVYSRRSKFIFSPTGKASAVAACFRLALLDWGIPNVLRIDNGRNYKSKHISAVCSALEIGTPPIPKDAPDRKPFVERGFGSLMRFLAEMLPGYCGHSVGEAQAIRERAKWAKRLLIPGEEAVRLPLSLDELEEITERYIVLFENRPHRGLGGKTPMQVWRESPQHPPKIRDERVLDILLAPVKTSSVQKKGIRIDGADYVAPELVEHIGKHVDVRRDLKNAGLIYVFASDTGKFICNARADALEGETLEAYLAAKARHRKGINEKAKALEVISAATPEPHSILLDEGRVETLKEASNLIPFQPEADSSTIREARKAASDVQSDLPRGLADAPQAEEEKGSGLVIPLNPPQPAVEAWGAYPEDLLDNPIELYLWFERKAEAVGLSDDERSHMAYLVSEFPAVRFWLEEVRAGESVGA